MAFVQGTTGANFGATCDADSITVTSGNVVMGMVFWQDGTPYTLTSVARASGTATIGEVTVLPTTTQGSCRMALFYCSVTGNGTLVIRSTLSGGSGSTLHLLNIHEVSDTTTYDKHRIAPQEPPPATTDGVSSGAITPSVADSYIFGCTAQANGIAITQGTGFASRTHQATMSRSEDLTQAGGPSSVAATFTAGSSSGTWLTAIMAFNTGAAPPDGSARLWIGSW
jgi:hypothetical protein